MVLYKLYYLLTYLLNRGNHDYNDVIIIINQKTQILHYNQQALANEAFCTSQESEQVSEQFLNGTSVQHRPFSAIQLKVEEK